MNDVILGSLVIFAASFIQGVTGFGFALLAVPLLSYILPLKSIVPLVVFYSLVTNLFILKETRNDIKINEIRWVIIFGIIGIPAGVYFLKVIDVNILKILIGSLILITAIAMMQGFKIKMKNEVLSSGIAGFLSGFLNGSVSMSGPPVVIFLTNRGSDKDTFRANLTAYAIITNIITIGSFIISGVSGMENIGHLIYLFPGLLAGVFAGTFLVRKINEALFKNIVLVLIIITGVTTVITTIQNLV